MAVPLRDRTTSLRRFLSSVALFCVVAWVGLPAVTVESATTTTTLSSSASVKWVDQDVSFRSGGLTIYATYRHPVAEKGLVSAVLLIAGSGPTDRDGNSSVEPGPINTLKTLADWLSLDGVASLRYDKLGSGKTGLGPFVNKIDSIGITPFEQESLSALKFLASQKGVDDQRLGVFGQSEGALFALLLATGHAGSAPAIHALGLLEPLSLRYLSLITVQVDAQVAAQLKAGAITKKLADTVDTTLDEAVTRLRATGKVKEDLPYGLDSVLNAATAKFLYQSDQFDPMSLAATVPAATAVFLTCSNDDVQVSCSQVERIAQGLSSAGASVQFVHLVGVDHVLKVDPSGSAANYTKNLAFSPALQRALQQFVSTNL